MPKQRFHLKVTYVCVTETEERVIDSAVGYSYASHPQQAAINIARRTGVPYKSITNKKYCYFLKYEHILPENESEQEETLEDSEEEQKDKGFEKVSIFETLEDPLW